MFNGAMNSFTKSLSALNPFMGLMAVSLLFTVLITVFEPESLDVFLSQLNFKTITMQTVIVGIGALGMTMVIISGGIDLSAGSMVALSTVVVASTMNLGAMEQQGNPTMNSLWVWLGVIAAIGACSFNGWLNGFLSTRFKIVPFIVTLGMMQVTRGVAKWVAGNEMVRTPDNALQRFMNPQPDIGWLFFAPGVWILTILGIIVGVMLKSTVFGRTIYAIGSSEKTSQLSGVPVHRIRVLIYSISGGFMGIAGVMQYATLGSGSPTEAIGMELDIIAAVVIGGGSLHGGEGSALGTLVGALIMSILRSGCVMLSVPSYIQEIVIGSIIIAAVGVDRLKHRHKYSK